ncbi:hypothetical protein BV898_09419 [Hypsibius exemplaris]|uniref:Uncharacterized protein n=1 Tax=Hypsibius exemplaris TaxID=2072580 RepID=A0A1W0WMK2_HYPEX|nr:hypothetical protein BV898_09419 [Hypsibius exemplaris]
MVHVSFTSPIDCSPTGIALPPLERNFHHQIKSSPSQTCELLAVQVAGMTVLYPHKPSFIHAFYLSLPFAILNDRTPSELTVQRAGSPSTTFTDLRVPSYRPTNNHATL